MVKPDFTKIWAGSRVSIPAISSPDYVKGFAAYLGPLPPQTDDHDYIMNLQDLRALWLEQELAAKTAAATDTTAGIVQLAVAANYPSASDTEVSTPAYVAAAVSGISSAAVVGTFSNLKASATGLSAVVTITADELIVRNGTSYKTLTSISVTPSLAVSGVNGLDTGASAINTWYADFVIWNPTTLAVAGLFSLSATAPIMPSGYTHKARVGWVRSDGTANKYPLAFVQRGNGSQYVIGTNIATLPILTSGAVGNISTPTYVLVATGNFVPPTASTIILFAYQAGPFTAMIAPNANYGAFASSVNPAPYQSGNGGSAYNGQSPIEMILESTNVYYAANAGALCCFGWGDNL